MLSWVISVRKALHQSELGKHESLCLLADILCRDLSDRRIWKSDSAGSFSSKSFYREIDPLSEVRSPCASIWMELGRPRVEAFCWLVVTGKIFITDNLRRESMSNDISNTCYLCRKEMETLDHLFIHCHVASFIWRYFLKACSVSWCFLGFVAVLFEAWKGMPLVGKGMILQRIIPLSILWSIWKERNDRIFHRKESSREELLSLVQLRIAKWACDKKEFADIKIDNFMQSKMLMEQQKENQVWLALGVS